MGSNPVATGSVLFIGTDFGVDSCKAVGVGADLPVACVSWEQVLDYAKRVSARDGVAYRLPTESEWEYAARGGQSGAWAGAASEDDLCAVANVANAERTEGYRGMGYDPSGWTTAKCDDGYTGLAPVGSFRANGYGLYDMAGNVREWVADWDGDYPTGSVSDPTGASAGHARVFRGGGWLDSAEVARVAYRYRRGPANRFDHLGFRLARTGP
jgi:sulfatase modifying factor 1